MSNATGLLPSKGDAQKVNYVPNVLDCRERRSNYQTNTSLETLATVTIAPLDTRYIVP